MYLVNESSKLEPGNRVYKMREKSQSLLDHPRIKLDLLHILYSSKEVLHHFDFFIFLSDILTNTF